MSIMTTGYLRTTGSAVSGETNLPRVAQGVYNRNLLMRSQPKLYHARFGQSKPMSARSGTQMVFRRYEKLAQATTPLVEGVTPNRATLQKTDYVATLKQYGNHLMISDWVDMTHVDPILTETSGLLGENMGETMDSVYREVLVAGTSVYVVTNDYTTGSGTPSAGTTRANCKGVLNKSVINKVLRDLRGADARAFTPIIPGSVKVNTYPIGESFWCLTHTDVENDLFAAGGGMSLGTEFTPVERYAQISGILPGEIGKYRNVRFVTSTNTKIFPNAGAAISTNGMRSTGGVNNDVYVSLFFARDAYGVVELGRGAAGVMVEGPGGPSDPLRQRRTVGWKAAGCAVILNDSWMIRVEHTSLD